MRKIYLVSRNWLYVTLSVVLMPFSTWDKNCNFCPRVGAGGQGPPLPGSGQLYRQECSCTPGQECNCTLPGPGSLSQSRPEPRTANTAPSALAAQSCKFPANPGEWPRNVCRLCAKLRRVTPALGESVRRAHRDKTHLQFKKQVLVTR